MRRNKWGYPMLTIIDKYFRLFMYISAMIVLVLLGIWKIK
jgi:hypothetical protein